MKSGSKESKTADERLVDLDRILDEYEHRLGIPVVGEDEVTVEARRLLALPPSVLKKLSCVECAEAAYVLGQYGHRLQQAANREQARVTWAAECIKRVISKIVNNYRGISFEERRLQAVGDNDAASKLDQIRVRAQVRIDRIAYLSNRANDMSKTLLSLGNAKRGIRE